MKINNMFSLLHLRLDVYVLRLVITYITTCLLVLISLVVFGQNEEDLPYKLDWSQESWEPGMRSKIFKILDSTQVSDPVYMGVSITAEAKGSFNAYAEMTPYIDGRDALNFGKSENLGVMFDPEAGQGLSPVFIKLRFSQPVQNLTFLISDIDAADDRKDSLLIFGNGKDLFPRLEVIDAQPTVKVRGRSAVAISGDSGSAGLGSAFGGEQNGDIRVTFGSELLDSVTIIYCELSTEEDPSARGIGLFADLSFQAAEILPMNLINFGVILDDNCQPVVRWSSQQEFDLEEYTIEYSYDGYNYFPTASVSALNTYTKVAEYDIPLHRGLNADNYFRLVRTNKEGVSDVLTTQNISGSECFNFTAVNVYPNPSSGNYVYVEIEATEQKPTDIAIIDQYGEVLVQTRYELKKGSNRFKLESRHLVPGLYSLRFAIGQEIVTKQVSILP